MILDGSIPGTVAFAAVAVVLKVTLLLGVAAALAVVLRTSSAAVRHQVWMVAMVSTLLVPLLSFAPGPLLRIPADWLGQQKADSPPAEESTRQRAHVSVEQRPETIRVWTRVPFRPRPPVGVSPSRLLNANVGDLLPKRPLRRRLVPLNDGKGTVIEINGGISLMREYFPPGPPVVPVVTPPADEAVNPLVVAGLLWGIGAVGLLAWRAVGYLMLIRLVRRSAPVVDASWLTSLRQCHSESGVARPVRLLSNRSFTTPVTAGWKCPVIILPQDIGVATSERRRAVLAHELAHIRRYDFVTQAFAAVATSLYWFHPLVWVAASRMRAESECAADDSVLERGMDAEHYAQHLLALAGRGSAVGLMPVVGMARITQLEQRLRAMFIENVTRAELTIRRQRVIAAASLVVVVPYASLRVGVTGPEGTPAVAVQQEWEGSVKGSGQVAQMKADFTAVAKSAIDSASGVVARLTLPAMLPMMVAPPAVLDTVQREPLASRTVPTSAGSELIDPTAEEMSARTRSRVHGDTAFEQIVAMNSGELLTLNIASGAHITIRGWDQPSAKLRATLGGAAWQQAHAYIRRQQAGVAVGSVSEREGYRIAGRETGYMYLGAPGPVPIPPSVDHRIEVWVPRHANIKVNSALGDVAIQDIEGTLSGALNTGNLELINTKGSANLTTAFGDLRIAKSTLTGDATTQCGSVTLSDVNGGIAATTAFDPAPYQAQGDAGKLMIVDGVMLGDYCDPRLRRFGLLPNRVNENNPYGDIVLDSAPNGGMLSTGRGGSIRVRASGGHISASTTTGNIELSNVRGDATARSKGGDIIIRLINTDGAVHQVHARTTNGTVIIELPDSLDARIEAEVVASDSAAAKLRQVNIRDEYGLVTGVPVPERVAGAISGSFKVTKGRGIGRIYVHVTDGDIIFRREKR